MVNEELRKAIADYFDPGDFAEFIGVTTLDLVNAFPDEVEAVLEDIEELMGVNSDVEDNYSEERE